MGQCLFCLFHTLLVDNMLIINILPIILGAFGAEDYAYLSVYQSLMGQCLFLLSHSLTGR